MTIIQKMFPILARLSYATAAVLVCVMSYSYYIGEMLLVRQSVILLLAVVLTFFVAKATIRFARVYVGGTAEKANCPITVINKNRQGKWRDKSHLVKRSWRIILYCSVVMVIYAYVVSEIMSYFWYN